MAYDFSASYETDGMPTNISSILSVGAFSFSMVIDHTPYTNASMKYSFKHSDDILLEVYYAQAGDWSEENIEIAEAEYDILNSANAYIQVMNIKLMGRVNAKALAEDMEALEEDPPADDSLYMQQAVDIVNENMDLIMLYADVNEKICEAEAYVYPDTYYECSYYELDEDCNWICMDPIERTYYGIDIRFVFADGSKVDAATYFSEGFDEFIDAWLALEL